MNDAEEHLMTVFSAALDRGSADERQAYLDRACAGDPALRQRVEALLRAHDRAGGFLGRSGPAETAGDAPSEGTGPAADPVAGDVIAGRYKLLEPIGEGGMGEVYLAEQTEPIRRLVALKVVKPGMDSRQVLARFEAERQALALMDHPNIAKVLDAGATPDGPALLRDGAGQGRADHQLLRRPPADVRERLELFADVCQAVQHAHQKGVIHRDLKPSNVLVAPVRRQAGRQGDRLRRGQGGRSALTEQHAVHRIRRGGRDAGVHEPGAGGAEQPGHRHPHRRLLARACCSTSC